jgi:DNA-binding transcriptional regulator PaaX
MTNPAAPRDLVDFQLAVLDAYEKLLASCSWDEAQLNEALKSMMPSLLPLLRAQRALGEQLLTSHQEVLHQYRRVLEGSLRQADAQPAGSG